MLLAPSSTEIRRGLMVLVKKFYIHRFPSSSSCSLPFLLWRTSKHEGELLSGRCRFWRKSRSTEVTSFEGLVESEV